MFVVKQVPVCNFIFINICLRCSGKGACAFIVYVGNSGFSSVFAILDSDEQLNQ